MGEKNGNDGKSFGKGGKIFIALIGGLIGIFLLISGGRKENQDTDKSTDDGGGFEQRLTMEEYRTAIEARVCAISAQVAGVGDAVAIVSLEGGFEYVYATDVKVSSAGESMQYIVIGSGSDEALVYLTEKVPKICGIGVVCDGGEDAKIKKELTYLLSAAFEVPTNKIYVTRKK
ncbi:MAG: hypothetical protein E7589_06095 [Ruminococcaceae bacterium]|nr:hypothetical protein [Oscillospiraceae bacterium]